MFALHVLSGMTPRFSPVIPCTTPPLLEVIISLTDDHVITAQVIGVNV
jgi:hypothetical protein